MFVSQMPSDNVPPRPSTTQPQSRAGPSWTPDFMKYPYPETERILTRLETLPAVKEETKGYVACIHEDDDRPPPPPACVTVQTC